jgi:hypothetical protein
MDKLQMKVKKGFKKVDPKSTNSDLSDLIKSPKGMNDTTGSFVSKASKHTDGTNDGDNAW